jgi:hypothetical protein
MSNKIIEIWRKEAIAGLPVRFFIGSPPMYVGPDNGLVATEGPAVSSIITTVEIKGVYRGVCYVVNFTDSPTKRVIPAVDVADIAYEKTKKKEGVDVPELEE